jgi:hypothetical protein
MPNGSVLNSAYILYDASWFQNSVAQSARFGTGSIEKLLLLLHFNNSRISQMSFLQQYPFTQKT